MVSGILIRTNSPKTTLEAPPDEGDEGRASVTWGREGLRGDKERGRGADDIRLGVREEQRRQCDVGGGGEGHC